MLKKVILGGVLFLGVVEGKGKKCPGHFGGKTGVANLCESHFPDTNSDKVWLVKFYAPWCGHCTAMKPAFEQLGKEFKNDPSIGIGGVDCDNASNKGICGKYGVQGFPTIKAIVNGKPKAYNGARDYGALKGFITNLKEKKGSKGGSAKCQKGIFKSTVKDSVSPLCAKHYPDEKSKNSWVIAFYNKDEFLKSDEFNRLALEFGNEPPEKNKQRKRIIKRSERIKEVVEKYAIKGEVNAKEAGKSKDPLAKFGAVCCDCEKGGKTDEKCEGLKLPHLRVYNAKAKTTFEFGVGDNSLDMDKFTSYTLEKLEYVAAEKKSDL